MKKVLLLLAVVFCVNLVSAAPSLVKPKKQKVYAGDIMIPLDETGTKISLLDLSKLTVKDAEMIRGKKMKLGEKIMFKATQRQLKKSIQPDGSFSDRQLAKKFKKAAVGGGFHLGGFALGFFLSAIGIIIALLIDDELKRSRVKWSIIGAVISFALGIAFII